MENDWLHWSWVGDNTLDYCWICILVLRESWELIGDLYTMVSPSTVCFSVRRLWRFMSGSRNRVVNIQTTAIDARTRETYIVEVLHTSEKIAYFPMIVIHRKKKGGSFRFCFASADKTTPLVHKRLSFSKFCIQQSVPHFSGRNVISVHSFSFLSD